MAKRGRKPGKKKKKKPEPGVKPSKVNVMPFPTAGAKVTDFEQKLDEQLAGGEPKPGRQRKQPADQEPDLSNLRSVPAIAQILKTPFELWSISQGVKELALEKTEAINLAEAVKVLLDYYLPQIPAIAYAWINLSVSAFWIMRTRLVLIAEIRKSKQDHQSSSIGSAGDHREGGQGGPIPQTKKKPVDPSKFPTQIETQKI